MIFFNEGFPNKRVVVINEEGGGELLVQNVSRYEWLVCTKCLLHNCVCVVSFEYKMFIICSVQNVWVFSTKCSWFNCKYKMFVQMSSSLSPELCEGRREEAPGDSYLTLSWQKQKFNLLQISLRSTHFVTVVNTTNENENLTYCGCGTRSKDALQV